MSDFEEVSPEVHLCTVFWLDSSRSAMSLHLVGYEFNVESRLYYLVTSGSEPVTHVVNFDAVSEITFEPVAGGAK